MIELSVFFLAFCLYEKASGPPALSSSFEIGKDWVLTSLELMQLSLSS